MEFAASANPPAFPAISPILTLAAIPVMRRDFSATLQASASACLAFTITSRQTNAIAVSPAEPAI
jgi:hypothetical protein